MNTENGVATFQANNRYEPMYPHIRAVPQPTLHVIKRLRAAGVRVCVEPEDSRPLCFTFQRGIGDWLADPAVALLASVPIGFAVNLLSSWWQDRKRRDREFPSATIAFVVDEDGELRYYDLNGVPLARSEALQLARRAEQSAKVFFRTINTPSPDARRRFPIQRDHSGVIVGWAAGIAPNPERDALKLVDVNFTDQQTRDDIDSGKLSGFSVGGIAVRTVCSVCRGNYVECDHVAGDQYEGGGCIVFIEEALPAEFSVVQDPINPGTKILR
jgi:hypothetical protein